MKRRRPAVLVGIGIAVAATTFVASCVTTFPQEPEFRDDTLVLATYRLEDGRRFNEILGPYVRIATVRVEAEPLANTTSVPIIGSPGTWGAGRETSNIQLVRRADGLLAATGVPPGRYRLSRFEIDLAHESSTFITLYLNFRPNQEFEVDAASVANLGDLIISFVDESTVSSRWGNDHAAVETRFRERYPESLWLSREWTAQRM